MGDVKYMCTNKMFPLRECNRRPIIMHIGWLLRDVVEGKLSFLSSHYDPLTLQLYSEYFYLNTYFIIHNICLYIIHRFILINIIC